MSRRGGGLSPEGPPVPVGACPSAQLCGPRPWRWAQEDWDRGAAGSDEGPRRPGGRESGAEVR